MMISPVYQGTTMKERIFEITPEGHKLSRTIIPIYIDNQQSCDYDYGVSVNFKEGKFNTELGFNGNTTFVFKIRVFKNGRAWGSNTHVCKDFQDNHIIPYLLEQKYIREITDLSKILDTYQAAQEKNELPLKISKENALTLFLNADGFTKKSDDEVTEYTLLNASPYFSENGSIKCIFYKNSDSFELI